ncbi:MAG: hypothetical protein PHD61_07535 [Bacteroidales bacterium]|nr:hypothetical protein [Lentimicrobiaceae bacterium]MDD5695141.1 hypothetical protein [Bacteroidales bacterium]
MNSGKLTGKILVISAFAIAMAFLESAVVVYLRELYYPGGFDFPLTPMDSTLALTEVFREAATLVMLVSIGLLMKRRPVEVFAVFLLAFGIWDIFYYVFLKCLIGWPSSWLTWDILFLIPTLWTGPVIAPLINSVVMIVLGFLILFYSNLHLNPNLTGKEWWILIAGAMLIYVAYTEEFTRYLLDHLTVDQIFNIKNQEEIARLSTQFIPARFPWWLYLSGCLLHGLALVFYRIRMHRLRHSTSIPSA